MKSGRRSAGFAFLFADFAALFSGVASLQFQQGRAYRNDDENEKENCKGHCQFGLGQPSALLAAPLPGQPQRLALGLEFISKLHALADIVTDYIADPHQLSRALTGVITAPGEGSEFFFH